MGVCVDELPSFTLISITEDSVTLMWDAADLNWNEQLVAYRISYRDDLSDGIINVEVPHIRGRRTFT
jgi:hypothetical protein